jgi:uncharacterized protein Yka (UPF0111/DUF47 family)
MEKGAPKITSPIKPLESSIETHEENEDIHNQLSNLENKIDELNDRSRKKSDLINVQVEVEKNMDENRVQMENKMDKRWNN